jgi:putative tryptophan/tyrosine transport system substrate-binding protein
MRRIGVLLSAAADDAEFQVWVGAFLHGLALLGWTLDRNVRIETRWAGAKAADIRNHAAELVALAPDLILAPGSEAVGARRKVWIMTSPATGVLAAVAILGAQAGRQLPG